MRMVDTVIVILCGWAGSQEKHLLLYEELLRRILLRSCKVARVESIRCSLPLHLVFSPVEFPRTAWVKDHVMRPLRACVSRLDRSERAMVVVQAFSNGGGFVVEQLYNLYQLYQTHGPGGDQRLPPIGGIVFDSAPGYDGGEMGEKVLAEVLGTGSWYQRAGVRVLHGTQRFAARLLHGSRQRDYWRVMTEIGDWCPTLHLYSMDDHLCDPDKLNELIMSKVGRGMDVEHRCWEVSAHCGHYKFHKDEYEDALSCFLVKALGNQEQARAVRSRL